VTDDLDDDYEDDDDLDEGDDRYEDRLEDLHADGAHLGNPNPDCEDCVLNEMLASAATDDFDVERSEPRRWYAPIDRRLRRERKNSLLYKLRDAAELRLPRPRDFIDPP
jgi:hypothetical protein